MSAAEVIPSISEVREAIDTVLAVPQPLDTLRFLTAFQPTSVSRTHVDALSITGHGLIPSVDTYRGAEKAVSEALGRKAYLSCRGPVGYDRKPHPWRAQP